MKKIANFLSYTFIPCTFLASTALAINANAQANTDKAEKHYQVMQKQLNIMRNIIKSSVVDEKTKQHSKITGIDSTYLAGQGVVLTISSKAQNNRWGNFNFNFVMPELPELPKLPDMPSLPTIAAIDNSFDDFQINETVSQALESASEGYERAIEVIHSSREVQRDIKDKQRDLSYEIRDLEREKKDLTYRLRRDNDKNKKELQTEIKKLEQRKKELEVNLKALNVEAGKLKEKHQQEKEQRLKERTIYYNGLTTSLADTLCFYGNGLRELPKTESVSVILKSGGAKEERRYKDKIFIFSKKDINDCSSEKINSASLLKKAKAYEF